MKLSVRWIFDHLKADYKKYPVQKIVDLLTAKTAEVEGFTPFSVDTKSFFLGRISHITSDGITVTCPELKKDITLSVRDDVSLGDILLIKKETKSVRWALLTDWGTDKEGAFPPVHCKEEQIAGGWRKDFPDKDTILEVDNKSITNRPDLWSHRGFARELSALLNVPFVAEKNFLADIKVISESKESGPHKGMPFSVSNKAPKVCKRFAALHLNKVAFQHSSLIMATRLASVDARPINFLVDATNYVMFDIGQPLHAFDAQSFSEKSIVPRMAKANEKLTLLDDTEITLSKDDLVITDGKNPVALAGVMGGKFSGIHEKTTSVLLESANFDATAIRLSATRHKLRTDASARFEKTLDPNQNVAGIKRFVKLLNDADCTVEGGTVMTSIGKEVDPLVIPITHDFIEKRIGETIKKRFVVSSLESLGFSVVETSDNYTVTVPSFRCTKDVTLPEDIVEEVARLYGYDAIAEELPQFQTQPKLQHRVYTMRKIKQHLSFSAAMREVENYPLFDNDFLRELNWKLGETASLKNPLSEQRTHLVTSLIPHLLQNVKQNMANHDELRFFEVARVWKQEGKELIEKPVVAGMFYKKKNIDFFDCKQHLQDLFGVLDIHVQWKKSAQTPQWASKHQVAHLFVKNKKIGVAGVITQKVMSRLGQGEVFAFGIYADALLGNVDSIKQFTPLSKYQPTYLDISMMVQTKATIADLVKLILAADQKISDVRLVDEFCKDEWGNKKSITMRFCIKDATQNLSKDVIEKTYKAVCSSVKKYGAEIR